MHIPRNIKALSTIIWIILLFCSLVIGAFLAYMWVMGNFYAEPENTITLAVTDVTMPVNHGDYFNMTILNPSHSISAVNITKIYYTVEGNSSTYNVTDTSPEKLPLVLERGASKSLKCKAEWGRFAGSGITVHVAAINASGSSAPIPTEFVKFAVLSYFDPTTSAKYFNVSVSNNAGSAINLTLDKVYLDTVLIENVSATFPYNLSQGGTVLFQCFAHWQGHNKPLVRVETLEGYSAEIRKEVQAAVSLTISDTKFNLTNPNADNFNVTLFNAAASAADLDVTQLSLTYENGTKYSIDTSFRVSRNRTASAVCSWSWKNYRDKNVTITALTKQGFTSEAKTVKTPKPTVFDFSPTFNLTRTGSFLVNVTNVPCSLQSINVTKIKFNQNITATSPAFYVISAGGTWLFNCTWNWQNFRGQGVTINVTASEQIVAKSITLPIVDLKLSIDFNSTLGVPYANVTISSTGYSNRSVTVKQIMFATNVTYTIDGTLTNPVLVPNGYVLNVGTSITIVCPWNWTRYHSQNVTVTVQTKEGFTVSGTFLIP